nr:DUF6506 family protein [Maliibacterium massiliense]
MAKKQFAFMLMGAHFVPSVHSAHFDTADMHTCIVTVRSLEEACEAAARLYRQGVRALELCGAFGEAGARKITACVGDDMAVGFVTHLPEQDARFDAFFGGREA